MSGLYPGLVDAKKKWAEYYARREAPEGESNSRPPKSSYTSPFGALPLSYRAAYSTKFVGNLTLMILGPAVIFFHHGNYWSFHWYSKWALMLTFFLILLSVYTASKTSWYLLPITLFSFLSASRAGLWADHAYAASTDPLTRLALEKNCLYAILSLVFVSLFVSFFRREWFDGAKGILATVFITSTQATLLLPWNKSDPIDNGVYSGNPSMNGCLIAATLPFVLYWIMETGGIPGRGRRKFLCGLTWLAALGAIFRTDGSAPILILGVSTTVFLWRMNGTRVLKWVPVLALFLLSFGQFTVHHQPFFHESGRFYIWKLMFHWWHDHSSLWIGTGLGTIQIITPVVQVLDDPKVGNYFLWLHNEWLQMLVEMGYVGFATVLIAWAYLMKKAYASPDLFAGLCAFTAMGFVNYPLRLPIHALCLTLICAMAIRSGDRESVRLSSETLAPLYSCM